MVTLLILVVPGVSYAAESGAAEQSGKVEIEGITGMIYSLCLALGGGLLWLGGMFLDYAVGFLVIGMGEILRGGLGVAVDSLWIVIRDIFNLLFIFGLIYIGFKTIWNAGEYNTRKFLITLIGAALLINFSLYITKAVVDFSNITAFQIYNLIEVEGVGVAGEYTGVASGFMQYLNLETLSNQSEAGILTQAVADDGELPNARILVYGFMVLIFSLVAAFVFAAGAIFLVTRFIALILFMIFSPAMFLGLVFPGLESYTKQWWKGFISYALVAPAFLFMLYLSLTLARELQTGGTFAGALADTSGASGTFQIILMFFVITGLIIASLMVAKQLGDTGAAQAGKAGTYLQNKARMYAGGAVFGGGAMVGRNTVGRAAQAYKETKFAQRLARRGGALGTVGRASVIGADKASNASFDARNVGGVGKQFNIGEGKKGGFAQRQKNIETREQKIAKLVGTEDERYYRDVGVEDIHEWREGLITQRERARADLSNTRNEAERTRLTQLVNQLETEIRDLENNGFNANQPPPEFNGTPEQWREEVERVRKYNTVRSSMKNTIQNEYAANLQQRGVNLPHGLRGVMFIRSTRENSDAADSIRKEVNKKPDDKLIDAIKGIKLDKKED